MNTCTHIYVYIYLSSYIGKEEEEEEFYTVYKTIGILTYCIHVFDVKHICRCELAYSTYIYICIYTYKCIYIYIYMYVYIYICVYIYIYICVCV